LEDSQLLFDRNRLALITLMTWRHPESKRPFAGFVSLWSTFQDAGAIWNHSSSRAPLYSWGTWRRIYIYTTNTAMSEFDGICANLHTYIHTYLLTYLLSYWRNSQRNTNQHDSRPTLPGYRGLQFATIRLGYDISSGSHNWNETEIN